jgi:putative tryptophan/tyrosine transport system substrate-binding protein
MRRREFITLLGSAAAAWPLAARAQQAAMPVVAFFNATSLATKSSQGMAAAFRQGLQETGFIEGRNLAIEYRWAENQYDRLPALAADLVQRRVAVIAAGPRAVNAAQAATTTIPIVFMAGGDPVRGGFVTSLNRPDGNLTGVTIMAGDINGKRFGLLHDLVPQAGVIGVLWDKTNPGLGVVPVQDVQAAARSLGVQIRVMSARTEDEIETAFTSFAREGVTALFVVNGLFFYDLADRLVALAMQHRIGLSGELRVFPEAGGLMSYGPNEFDAFRQVGRYTGRVLKGEKPGDLPVLQPTKINFVINLKNAKALGLEIPPSVLAIADEVIE